GPGGAGGAGKAGGAGQPHHDTGVSPFLYGSHGRPDRRARWCAGCGGWHPRNAHGQRRPLRRTLRDPSRGLSLIDALVWLRPLGCWNVATDTPFKSDVGGRIERGQHPPAASRGTVDTDVGSTVTI